MKYLQMLGIAFLAVSLQAQNHQNTYPLDSTVYESFNQYWYKHFKHAYLYDGNLNITEYTYYNWHDPDGWSPSQRYQYTFDLRNLLISELRMSRNSEGWINWRKTEHNYDESQNQSSYTNYRWDKDSNSWNASGNTQFEINESGQISKETIYRKNPEDGGWMIYTDKEYTYNSSGQIALIETDEYAYADGSFSGANKKYYVYNSDGLQISYISTHLETNTDIWENDGKREWVYDLEGHILSYTEYDWPYQAEDWKPRRRDEYQYDSRGNEIIKVELSDNDGSLQEYLKRQKYYNSQNQKDSCLTYSYRSREAVWRLVDKNEYHYDAFDNMIQDVFFGWDQDDNQWFVREQNKYYYAVSSGISDDNLDDQIVVYPNPSSGMVHIEGLHDLAKISIHDMNGREVKSSYLSGNSIDISELPSGLYFLHLFPNKEKPLVFRLLKL